MKILPALLTLGLAGCLNMADMTAGQIRATNGLAMCTQATTMYGKGSSITVNADDVRKGATGKGKTAITCGDATMVIDHDVGVAPVPSKP